MEVTRLHTFQVIARMQKRNSEFLKHIRFVDRVLLGFNF